MALSVSYCLGVEISISDFARGNSLGSGQQNPGRREIRITAVSLENYLESITIDPEFWLQ